MPSTPTAPSTAQSIAVQLEKVRPVVKKAFETEDVLLDFFKENGDVEVIGTRAVRAPIYIRPGGAASQGTGDFDDKGRGSGSVWDFATVSTIEFHFAFEVSKLAEYATDSKSKAVENVATAEVANAMENFKAFLDRLTNTAGSGVLDTIGAIATSTTFTVTNADMFFYNQLIQVYSSTLATNRGLCKVVAVDPLAKTITVDAAPGGTIAGDVLVININQGTSGANPVSLQGLLYTHVDSATGSWQGLARSSYPEALKTPHIAAAAAAITPGMVRLLFSKIRRVLGSKQFEKEELIPYMNVDQEAAWENTGLNVSSIIINQVGGSNAPEVGKKSPPATMMGRKIMSSIHATPGRVDMVMPKHWWRAVTKEIDFFEEGGQTVFPLYGTSGGLLSGYISYLDTVFQIGADLPRFGGFIDGAAQPPGY
jgi:hypothetical protein